MKKLRLKLTVGIGIALVAVALMVSYSDFSKEDRLARQSWEKFGNLLKNYANFYANILYFAKVDTRLKAPTEVVTLTRDRRQCLSLVLDYDGMIEQKPVAILDACIKKLKTDMARLNLLWKTKEKRAKEHLEAVQRQLDLLEPRIAAECGPLLAQVESANRKGTLFFRKPFPGAALDCAALIASAKN